MVINRKALASLLVALGVALGVFGLLIPDAGTVAAQATPSATRSLSSSSVAPGAEITVTINASNYGQFGGIIETLPDGFTFVSSDLPSSQVNASGSPIRFTLYGESSFTYTVTASDTAGQYTFSGVLRDDTGSRIDHQIPDTNITVEAADGGGDNGDTGTTPPDSDGPSASRSLSEPSVAQGAEVVVTITASGYGQFGGIIETLPDGFIFVSSDLPSSQVNASGSPIRFTLYGESSFTYTVTASDAAGQYTFSGVLRDDTGSRIDHQIPDTNITVEAPAPPSATRSFPSEYVDPGAELVVTIEASNYGQFGGVSETLPSGFTFVSSDLPSSQVNASGSPIRFTLYGESSFTYTVTASDTEGSYTFSGVLKDDQGTDYPMADSTIMVGTAPEPVTPEPVTPEPVTPEPVTPEPVTPEPDGTRPTRTPRPAAAPSTPVAIEIVSDVTMAEGATVVQPDASSVVSSSDGMATVMLPNTSRARTYQVMVSSDAAGCSGGDLAGAMQACVTITSYDAEGNMESGVMLIRRATVVMMLDAAAVEDLGGLPVVFQANALGAFSIYQRDGADDSWGMRRSTMGLTDDGGIAVTVTSLRSLGSLALAVDEEILQTAMYQVAGITPTPVPTPTPVAATATPVPTAVPTVAPTAVPPEVEPEVGDTTLPVGLLVVLALTGALMVYTGSRVMRRKPVTTRR